MNQAEGGLVSAIRESYSDDNDKKNSINEYYSQLINVFNKCHEKTYVYDNDSKQIMNQFFEFYHKWIRKTIIDKLSKGKPFDELEKMGMNCLCVSINIINLAMDKIGEIFVLELFDHLSVFRPYSETNAVARRMTEMILYCLCNYCNSETIKKNRRIYITSINKICLEDCFRKFATVKIKLSSAIVIWFLVFTNSELRRDVRMYLNELKENILSNSNDKYLGIKKELILSALDKRENLKLTKENEELKYEIQTKTENKEDSQEKLKDLTQQNEFLKLEIHKKNEEIEMLKEQIQRKSNVLKIDKENVNDEKKFNEQEINKLSRKTHYMMLQICNSFTEKDKIIDVMKSKSDNKIEAKKKHEIPRSHFASLTTISNKNDNDRSSEQVRKRFIGGLSFLTNEDNLKSHFEQCEEVVDVLVLRDGKMENLVDADSSLTMVVIYPEMVDAAQLNRPHNIDNRNVETKRVILYEKDKKPKADPHIDISGGFGGVMGGGVTILKNHFNGVEGLGGLGVGITEGVNIHLDKTDKGSMGAGFTFFKVGGYGSWMLMGDWWSVC